MNTYLPAADTYPLTLRSVRIQGAVFGAAVPGAAAAVVTLIGFLPLAALLCLAAFVGGIVGALRAPHVILTDDPATEMLRATVLGWLIATTLIDTPSIVGAVLVLVVRPSEVLSLLAFGLIFGFLSYLVGLVVALVVGLPLSITGVALLRRHFGLRMW